jgi:putative DNA primase/helicase
MSPRTGCTLSDYAAAKRLPEDFLRRLGLVDEVHLGAPAVRVPYRDEAGAEVAVRRRLQLEKGDPRDGRFCWRTGDHPRLYGLWRLADARAAGCVVLVEGESDAQTLWHHGIPALGIPGAGSWQEEWASALDGISTVFVVIEPDRGGKALRERLAKSRIRDRARLVTLAGAKDPSELHICDPVSFPGRWRAALDASEPWIEPPTSGTAHADDGGSHLTDVGNAERFVRHHGHDLRYVTAWSRWLVWDGVRWAADFTAEVVRRAKATVARIYGEAEAALEDERRDLARHAVRSESERAIRAMIALAESELAVRPEQLDADPWLLNVLNGTVDLRTGELRCHQQTDLITKLAPVYFDQAASHPVWDSFLELMLPDPEVRSFLQRAVGYSLTGDTCEEKLFFIHGPTAAGKTTFTGALRAMLGDYAAICDFESFLRKRGDAGVRNDIARLAGVRTVLSLEVDEGRHLAEALLKTLTGGDVTTARYLYKEIFEFKPCFKLWLVANDKPSANAGDAALWRRILLVPFEHSLPEDMRDPAVKATLTISEEARAAVLAWAVQGLRDWRGCGLRPPDAVRRATDAYREEQDTLTPFLADYCIVESGAFVASKVLRDSYRQWSEANDEKPLSSNALARRLRDRGFKPVTSPDHAKTRGWEGLRLRDASDASRADSADVADSGFRRPPHEARTREVCGTCRPQSSALSAEAATPDMVEGGRLDMPARMPTAVVTSLQWSHGRPEPADEGASSPDTDLGAEDLHLLACDRMARVVGTLSPALAEDSGSDG